MKPAGQDPETGARNGHSTALFAEECQSFLDNVMAGFGQIGAWSDPAGDVPWNTRGDLRKLADEDHSSGRRVCEARRGQSQAAPRTPLESPCMARTTFVLMPSEKV
jgi:hypothetical protein